MTASTARKRQLAHGPLASPLGKGAEIIVPPTPRAETWPPGGRIAPFAKCVRCGAWGWRVYGDGWCAGCERTRMEATQS